MQITSDQGILKSICNKYNASGRVVTGYVISGGEQTDCMQNARTHTHTHGSVRSAVKDDELLETDRFNALPNDDPDISLLFVISFAFLNVLVAAVFLCVCVPRCDNTAMLCMLIGCHDFANAISIGSL